MKIEHKESVEKSLVTLKVMSSLIAVLLALLVSALVILLAGANPVEAYYYLGYGSFGNFVTLVETLVRSTPILLVSLGLSICFTAKVWNIGAEGQLYIGGLAAAIVGLACRNLPGCVAIPIVLSSSGAAGLLWAFIPAILKAKYEINEIFTTVIMNYIGLYFVSYMLHGPLKDPISQFPESPTLPLHIWLPKLIHGTRFHLGILIALLIFVPLTYYLREKTIFGFELKLYGANPKTAVYSGVKPEKVVLLSLLISGLLAGLAGGIEVTAIQHKMRLEISPGYGFTGIAVALLGQLNAIGVLAASIFMGAIINGSYTMHRMAKIPVGMAYFIQGLLIVFVVAGNILYERMARETIEVKTE